MALVQAGQQLVKEIDALEIKDAEVSVLDEVDGLGFHRSVRINAAATKELPDAVVEALARDDRVAEVVRSNKGLRVEFVSDVRADFAQPFDLADGMAIADES